ncbi:nuclease-related domain-containing protein [Methanobacterium oryzae]|uniref:nuclease-related domain-containing protein n=1 Tax=Methanobacterium oryzae TaxID=69540 RepID=UPI003D23C75A
MGEIFVLIGILGFIITPILLILLFIGVGLIIYGNNKSKSWNKGIKKDIIEEYLNQLPNDYYIFNDVKFPGSDENVDYLVLGHNGIFVIKTKNYNGHYIINDNDWFYKKGRDLYRIYKSPSKQVMNNAISLRKFLMENGVNMNDVWVNSIVTLSDNNFKIEKKPRNYNILSPSTIPQYILNSDRCVDIDVLKEAALLIEPYCIEMSYTEL